MRNHRIEFMALAMLAAACDGELMAGLPKQTVNIPITGGLDTKTGPLAQTPGTFLQLDDVRQERRHEWRNRNGLVLDALDDVGSAAPLRTVELPDGGLFGLGVSAANASAALTYSRNVPSTMSRFQQAGPGVSSAITPSHWQRRIVSTSQYAPYMTTVAVGNGLRFVAWKPGNPTVGQDAIHVMIVADADGKVVTAETTIGVTGGWHPKVVYDAVSGTKKFVLFWLEGSNLKAHTWDATTGVGGIGPATTLKTNVNSGGAMDAIQYVGSNSITVVYSQTGVGSNAHQLEVVPSTLGLPIDVDLGVSADAALSLLPDPDASGLRFIGVGSFTPATRVLRTNSLGAIQTNDLVEAVLSDKIAGVAYQAGAGWMIVYEGYSAGFYTLKAAKKRSGVVSAVATLAGGTAPGGEGGPGAGAAYRVDSNAWREAGTDPMRYIAGLHVGLDAAVATDFQASYFEMALEYENAASTISNNFTEPQARLIPLNAGPVMTAVSYAPVQVIRTGTNAYTVSLARIAQPILSAGRVENQYAIDTWDQSILSTSIYSGSHPNLGPGVTGPQTAYLPAGLLLQSARGQLIAGHGASALPFRPSGTLAAFAGGLNVGQSYQYLVSEDVHDDSGSIWRSARSVASAVIIPTAGNTQVNVTVGLPTLENATRLRTVKLWRTLGNGATANAQLVHQRTILCNVANQTFTFNDTVTDATLAQSSFLPIGLPATITPAFTHVAFFDGRMWGVERDFPRRVRFSQPNAFGIAAEFPVEFFVDVEDEYGDITGIYSLDDKLILTKDRAIYFAPKGGPALDGTGSTYSFTRLDAEVGSQSGTPAISTGSTVWFFHGGMYSIDRSLHITHHDAIERYFNHPLLTTPEVPISLTHNGKRDEIRLLTTNYRFVYDMANAVWIRDTGVNTVALPNTTYVQTLTDVGDMFFRSNGDVWWDYDVDQGTADPTGAIRGVLRSPWIRAAQPEGYFRIYRERALYKIEASGAQTSWPETTIYFNDNDAISATTTRVGTSGTTKQTTEARNARGKVTSFSLAERLPAGNVTWRLSQWSVLLALKKAMHADSPAALGRATAP